MSTFGLVPYRRGHRVVRPYTSLVDSFFDDDFFKGFFTERSAVSKIKVDVRNEDDKYVLEAELPGLKKEDINIDIEDNVLTLSAKVGSEKNEEKEEYVYRERSYGAVKRSFSLDNIKEEDIKAEYKDGILRVDLPKAEPYNKISRSIDIK